MPCVLTPTAAGFTHPVFTCEACGRPACYGFGCYPSAGRSGFENGKWYCARLGSGPACSVSGVAVVQAMEPGYDRSPLSEPGRLL